MWSEALLGICPTELPPSVLLASLPQLHDYMAPATSVAPQLPNTWAFWKPRGSYVRLASALWERRWHLWTERLIRQRLPGRIEVSKGGDQTVTVMAVVQMQSHLSSPLVPVVLPWHGAVEEQARWRGGGMEGGGRRMYWGSLLCPPQWSLRSVWPHHPPEPFLL